MSEWDWKNRVDANFSELKGKTLKKAENNGDEIVFTTTEGEVYHQVYYSDCCASCSVEEIHGELQDLVGTPILMAEEVSSEAPSAEVIDLRKALYKAAKAEWKGAPKDFYWYGPSSENGWRDESETWTFYKLATINGSVTIRWYGSSNGYYSESPTFEKFQPTEERNNA